MIITSCTILILTLSNYLNCHMFSSSMQFQLCQINYSINITVYFMMFSSSIAEIFSHDVIYTHDFFMQVTTYAILHILSESILKHKKFITLVTFPLWCCLLQCSCNGFKFSYLTLHILHLNM